MVVYENGWFDGKEIPLRQTRLLKKLRGEMTLVEAAKRGNRFRL